MFYLNRHQYVLELFSGVFVVYFCSVVVLIAVGAMERSVACRYCDVELQSLVQSYCFLL